jgi:hypothetical protein
MTTLRFLFILFLLLDVLAFAASRGVFSSDDPQPDITETKRADTQIRPDRIQILGQTPPAPTQEITIQISPAPPPGTVVPPPAPAPEQPECMAWSGLGTTQSNRLVSLLAAVGIKATAREVAVPTAWKVRIPSQPSRSAAEELVRELIARGIEPGSIMIERSGPNQNAIALGHFDIKANATRRLEALKAKGVQNVQIDARNGTERQVEVTAPATAVEAALAGQAFAKQHKPCRQ